MDAPSADTHGNSTQPSAGAKPTRRRWFQFSIRSVLILMFVVAIGLGYEAHRAQEQRRPEAMLGLRKWSWSVGRTPRWFLSDLDHMPDWQRNLADQYPHVLMDIESSSVISDELRDDDLAWLAKVPKLTYLHLGGPHLTDDGWRHLQEFAELQSLSLKGSSMGDEGLRHLSSMQSLQSLDLAATKITDAGLKQVAGLPNLMTLNLSRTRVTNDGMRHLVGAPNLSELDLTGTAITGPGLAHLQQLASLLTLRMHPTPRSESPGDGIDGRQKSARTTGIGRRLDGSVWRAFAAARPDVDVDLGLQSDEDPAIRVLPENGDTEVQFSSQGDTTIIEIKCERGIDAATVKRVGDRWPNAIEVELHLKGLELFEVTCGPVVLSISVPSSGELQSRTLLRQGGKEIVVDDGSPYWTSIGMVGRNGEKIPLQGGYFEIELPAKLFEANPPSIQLRWVDFYRN